MGSSSSRTTSEPQDELARYAAALTVPLAGLDALVFTGGLSQSLYKDEKHNWSTTLRFVDYQVPPTLEELRTYPEVVTPLSYIIWSGIEDVTHAGIRAGRGLEFVLSLGLLAIIAGRRRPDDTALLCGVGLLLYPYLLPLSIHLYTDVLAAFLGLAGLAFYSHRRFAVAAVFLGALSLC